MTEETSVHLLLNSASLFDALKQQVGAWCLQDHQFDPQADEVKVSYDVGGSGRVAVTLGFELDREQLAHVLQSARPLG